MENSSEPVTKPFSSHCFIKADVSPILITPKKSLVKPIRKPISPCDLMSMRYRRGDRLSVLKTMRNTSVKIASRSGDLPYNLNNGSKFCENMSVFLLSIMLVLASITFFIRSNV